MKRVLAGLAAVAAVAIAPGVVSAQDETVVTLYHGIPGVPVDVSVDGTVLLPGFEPGATQDLSAFAGQSIANLAVLAAGTEDVVIGPVESFDVPGSGNWTVMAHLDAEGAPTITAFENDTAPTPEGQGRVTVRHTAAAPAVDLVVGDARPIEGAANGDEAALTLPAGPVSGAQLAPTGEDPIIDVPDIEVVEGVNLIVYAVGSLADETFEFYTQEIEVGTDAAGGDEAAAEEGDGTEEDAGTDDEAAAEEGDDTDADAEATEDVAVPTEVNTGSGINDGSNVALFAAAAGLLVLAGGALTLRRRTLDS